MTPPTDAARRARRELTAFLVATFAISWSIAGYLISRGKQTSDQGLLALLMMWTPGLVSIACRLAMRLGFRDVSFSLRGPPRAWLLAWLAPLAVGLLAYGFAWATGIQPFHAPPSGSIEHWLHTDTLSAPLRFAAFSGVMLFLGTGMGSIAATGEELGWRGFMTTRLIDSGVPRPLLVGGLIWGVWHLPLILSGLYAAGPSPWLSPSLFMVNVVAAGYLAAIVRLRTGSVWPAVVFHATWNAQIQVVFNRFSALDSHGSAALWLGESGVLVCMANLVVAGLVLRSYGTYGRS
jgi:membrane protease YdiL (CAAX protease family)